jgi:hypothetical protein
VGICGTFDLGLQKSRQNVFAAARPLQVSKYATDLIHVFNSVARTIVTFIAATEVSHYVGHKRSDLTYRYFSTAGERVPVTSACRHTSLRSPSSASDRLIGSSLVRILYNADRGWWAVINVLYWVEGSEQISHNTFKQA